MTKWVRRPWLEIVTDNEGIVRLDPHMVTTWDAIEQLQEEADALARQIEPMEVSKERIELATETLAFYLESNPPWLPGVARIILEQDARARLAQTLDAQTEAKT